MKKLIIAAMLLASVTMQAQRFDWVKGWEGLKVNEGNYITGTVTDRAGNLYLLANYEGQYGHYAMWDSVRLTVHNSTQDGGMVLARISPQGTMVWKKIVHESGGSTYSHELRMVGDSAIACMFTFWMPFNEYSKLYYLDTLLEGAGNTYPASWMGYENYLRTALVIIGLDGSIREQHILHLANVDSTGQYLFDTNGVVQNTTLVRPSFDIDADGNIYIIHNGAKSDGLCLLDGDRRVGVVSGWQGTPSWCPAILKLSPHLDTLLSVNTIVSGNTAPNIIYDNYLRIRVGTDGNLYAYGVLRRNLRGYATQDVHCFDTLLFDAPGMHHGCGYSAYENALLVEMDTALVPHYVVSFGDSVLRADAAEYWEGYLGSSFRELAFDADSGLLFLAGDCWQLDRNQPWQSAQYFVAGQPVNLVNDAYVVALNMTDGSLHSVARVPSLKQAHLGWDDIRHVSLRHPAGLTVGGNRVFLQSLSIGGVYYPNFYHGDIDGRKRLTLAQFDYAGHVVRGYDFNAVSDGDLPFAMSMRDSLLYITDILRGSPHFDTIELQPSVGYDLACVAMMLDTALMSSYVYTAPDWVDTTHQDPVHIVQADGEGYLVVYPNPTAGSVTVKAATGVVSAWLTDLMGCREEVRLKPAGDDLYSLDLADRPYSTYLLTVITATGDYHTVRLMKL